MLPGPVSVPAPILEAMTVNYDAGHIEDDHLELYRETGGNLAKIMGTRNDVVIMSGEAMVILWGALKSCLKPGDRLLCVDTGVFGAGFADMGASIGCKVEKVTLPPDQTVNMGDALERIDRAVEKSKPKMITVVHCETPSGTLNPLEGISEIKKRRNVPLLCVDAVSSLGGMPFDTDGLAVDITMGGTQKCLSAPPSMGFASVSPAAWEAIKDVAYQGYDAFLPYLEPVDGVWFPYTPYRQGTAALNAAARMVLGEGLDKVKIRHERIAEGCRGGLEALGIKLFPAEGAIPSPTVTAAYVPDGKDWAVWSKELLAKGLCLGGSFGPLKGRVFRLGHMGAQADEALMRKALVTLAACR